MSPRRSLCRGESVRPPNRDPPIYLGNLPLSYLSSHSLSPPPLSPSVPPLSSSPSSSSSTASVTLSTPTPASYPHPWPLPQPTLLRTQRTPMPSPRSSFPIMPARSSVRVRTSSASQSSHSASQGVYSSVIGQSPGQSALPSKLAPT